MPLHLGVAVFPQAVPRYLNTNFLGVCLIRASLYAGYKSASSLPASIQTIWQNQRHERKCPAVSQDHAEVTILSSPYCLKKRDKLLVTPTKRYVGHPCQLRFARWSGFVQSGKKHLNL